MKKLIQIIPLFFLMFTTLSYGATDDYPTRSIRLIIPAAPGGGVDIVGRVLATRMSQTLGKSVVPDNKPGAGTMLGSQELASASPDGYTLLAITSSHAVNAAVRKLKYDPIKDFAMISLVGSAPDILVVNSSSPIHSLNDLLAAAKKDPGKMTFGSAGQGSGSHMDAELLKNMTGIDILHVPYRGGMPAVTALLGNETNMMFLSAVGLQAHIKAGKLRAIAVTGKERTAMFPDVPTMSEAGLPTYSADVWYGIVAPAKTPPAIIAILNKSINDALKTPEVRGKLISAGIDPIGTTPQAFNNYVKEDISRWQKVVDKSPQLRVTD
jgi:tripartite-type tricarboxylate transporter receptor subunit TctC